MELYGNTDVPLLKLGEEDFESLENDQLVIQSMLASRFVKQFEVEAGQVILFVYIFNYDTYLCFHSGKNN